VNRAIDFVKSLEGGAVWDDACAFGRAFLAGFVGGPVAALDFALTSREGCVNIRWLARRMFGVRAAWAIAQGMERAMQWDLPGQAQEERFRREVTDEVAGWIRVAAIAWEQGDRP
jgi:hypothetical protein